MRELSLNVMDVAQNSIKAEASLIEIAQKQTGEKLVIELHDNGYGMTKEQVENVISPFFTSRTTRSVGLGVPLFKMACEQTGGSFSIESEKGKGTSVFARFVTSHIDMTPVGDMNETILLLITGNPDIDFVYTHELDGRSFTLDTRELREVLGDDVPLSAPDVVDWIRGNLTESEAELLNPAEVNTGG